MRLWFLLCACIGSSVQAQDLGLADRLRALAAPDPAPLDLYGDEALHDRDLIARHAAALFGMPAAQIVMFTGSGCATCPALATNLTEMAKRQGVTVNLLDSDDPAIAGLMAQLSLDTVPSYVMADRMIRGDIPMFVLERYLGE